MNVYSAVFVPTHMAPMVVAVPQRLLPNTRIQPSSRALRIQGPNYANYSNLPYPNGYKQNGMIQYSMQPQMIQCQYQKASQQVVFQQQKLYPGNNLAHNYHRHPDDTLQRDGSKASHLPHRKDDRIAKHADGSLAVKCQKHKSAKHVQRHKNHKLSHFVDSDQKKRVVATGSSEFNSLLGTRLNGIRNMEFARNGVYFASVTEESIIQSHNPNHRNSSASDATSNSDDINSVSVREYFTENYELAKVNKKIARVRSNRKQRREQHQRQQGHDEKPQQHESTPTNSGVSSNASAQDLPLPPCSNSIRITAKQQHHQRLTICKTSTSSSSTSSPSTSEANSASSSPTASPKAKRIGRVRQIIESPFHIIDILSEYEIATYMNNYIVDKKKLRNYGFPVASETHEGSTEIFKCVPRFYKPRQSYPRRHHNKALNSTNEFKSFAPIERKQSSGDSGKGSESSTNPSSSNGSPADSDFSEEEISLDFTQAEIMERKCERCKKFFKVTVAGEYVTKEQCNYHWGKQEAGEYFDPNGVAMTINYYSCCKRLSSDPCSQNHAHVWSDISVGLNGPYTDFIYTIPKRRLASSDNGADNIKIYALDCEMSYTGLGMEVTKVSVIGYNGQLVYETIVLPRSQIIDYNTRFSGVSAKDYESGKIVRTLSQVQTDLINLIDADDILIGHAIENDLRYLRLVHSCIVDTSIVFSHPSGFPFKRGLKSLVTEYLGRSIQTGSDGHSSCEDSQACLELMLLKVRADWMARTTKCMKFETHQYQYASVEYRI